MKTCIREGNAKDRPKITTWLER